jgi:hypothetical protein
MTTMSNGKHDDKDSGSLGPTRVRNVTPRGGQQGSETDATRVAGGASQDPPLPNLGGGAGSQNQTIIHRPGRPQGGPTGATPATEIASRQPATESAHAMQGFDPVVGWLVVLSGPGRGAAAPMFEGMNSVGRAPSERVQLDFGDNQISREGHFFLTFDPKERSFHIHHGSRINLVRLNGKTVLGPMPMSAGDTIEVGSTMLRFVPLCGPDFIWDDVP